MRDYYSREDIKKELLRISKDREVQIWVRDIRGKRPESVNYQSDIDSFIRQGMTSFHVSEERWHDPLNLKSGMSKKDLDELRKGWDLILDIDSDDLNYSKITAKLIIDALKFHDVKDYSIKFSGNKGFHIGIPYEAFPDKLKGENINLLFPDLVRNVANYLKDMIKPFLIEKLNKEDPFSLVDIDSVLISSRHMFRSPYSLNEKSGLISIPIKDVESFKIEDAKPENVKVNLRFLDTKNVEKGSARNLLIQSYDWGIKNQSLIEVKKEKKDVGSYERYTGKVPEENFPPCISKILKGIPSDGRKRSLFLLINFLRSVNWDFEEIENLIQKWNSKNYQPLKEGYIRTQIEWHKKQSNKVLPANCENESYYKSYGICDSDNLCKMIKNPVNYALRKTSIKKKPLKKSKNKK